MVQMVYQDIMDHRVYMDHRVHKDLKETEELLVRRALLVLEDHQGPQAQEALQVGA